MDWSPLFDFANGPSFDELRMGVECPHMAGASIHVVSLFHGLALTASEIEQKSDS